MPYTVDRYRSNAFTGQPGWPLTLNDSNINSNITSLKLIGRGVPNYGEFIAENFVHLLENFAGNLPPDNPITGQLWFEVNPNQPGTGILKVYNGVEFTPVTGATSGTIFPATRSAGQLHFNNGRLYVSDGTSWSPFVRYSQSTSDPLSGELGDIFYNTNENSVKVRIANPGAEWRRIVSVTNGDSKQQNNFGLDQNFYFYNSINENVLPIGTSQSTATVLRNNINVITQANTNNRSLRFDINTNVPNGTEITVINRSSQPLLVFPPIGISIDGLSTNTAFTINSLSSKKFVKSSSQYFSLS